MGLNDAKDPTFDESGQRRPHKGGKPPRVVAVPPTDFATDLARGRDDIAFFADRFLGVKLHRGQRRFAYMAQQKIGYQPRFLDIALSSGNRAGKTLILAVVVFHHTFYKFGIEPNDWSSWVRAPYHWYHVSYEGKVAYILHGELVKLFTGSHPAQKGRGCPLMEQGRIVEWDKKELAEYPWIKVHAGFGGGEIHFRHTNEKAKALLGLDMNGISFDETAFELYLNDIRGEVLHFRRLATGGPIYWISTPTEGYNAFADLWAEGDPENPNRHERAVSLRMSTRDNIGFGIDVKTFDDLIASSDPHLIPQNIDGYFIEARDAFFNAGKVEAIFTDLAPEQGAVKNHRYVNAIDPGITHDATWVLDLDITEKPYIGVRVNKRGGRQTVIEVVNMTREGHLLYSSDGARCTSMMDETGIGKVYRQEFSMIRPLRTFDFGGTKAKKLQLLTDLKGVIDRGDLRLPKSGSHWQSLRRQLLGYKLDDSKIEQDGVMTLAMAVRHAIRNPTASADSPSFDFFAS